MKNSQKNLILTSIVLHEMWSGLYLTFRELVAEMDDCQRHVLKKRIVSLIDGTLSDLEEKVCLAYVSTLMGKVNQRLDQEEKIVLDEEAVFSVIKETWAQDFIESDRDRREYLLEKANTMFRNLGATDHTTYLELAEKILG